VEEEMSIVLFDELGIMFWSRKFGGGDIIHLHFGGKIAALPKRFIPKDK